ncbi:Vinculin [Balamuthia mandrillaris]
MAETGMEQVLEAVADAVTQLVLFSVEAEENNSTLPNIAPGAEAVKQAVLVLVDIAEDMASKYGDEAKLQSKMHDSAHEIRSATEGIVEAARNLSVDPFDRDSKRLLLRSAKAVLQGTVRELHLADKYDVIKLVKAAQRCKEEVARSTAPASTASSEQMMDVARALSSSVVSMVKLVHARVQILVDPVLRRRLEEANTLVKAHTQSLVKAMGDVLRDPLSLTAKNQHRTLAKELDAALDEIIQVAQLSCKTMFESVDLGFEPAQRPTIQDLRECHEQILHQLTLLQEAVGRKDAPASANALHMINGAITREIDIATIIGEDCSDSNSKADILHACYEVEKMPADLTPATKASLQRNNDPSAKFCLENLCEETKQASAALLAACVLSSSAKDKLIELARQLDAHLVQLRENAEDGDKMRGANTMRTVSEEVGSVAGIARAIADTEEDLHTTTLIHEEVDFIEKLNPELMNSAKASLASPGQAQTLEQLRKDVQDMREAVFRLVDVATLSPDELLRKRTQELEAELVLLQRAIQDRDVQGAAIHLKAARERLAEQIAAARALADQCKDPVRKQKLENAIARLEEIQNQLVPLTKAALAGDKAAQAKLDQLLAEIGSILREIEDASHPSTEEELRDVTETVNEGLDRLADGLDKGDRAGAKKATRDVEKGLEKEVELLRKLQDEEEDLQRKDQLGRLALEMERVTPLFRSVAAGAIANPNDPRQREKLETVSRNIKAINTDIQKALPSQEDKIQQLALAIDKELDKLSQEAKAGNNPAATAAVKEVVRRIGSQMELANALVQNQQQKQGEDGVSAWATKHAQEQSAQLKALTPQLVKATKDTLLAPRDKAKQNSLDDAVEDVRSAVHALSAASTLAPEEQIVEGATSINSRLNQLQDEATRGDKESTAKLNKQLERDIPKQIDLVKQYQAAAMPDNVTLRETVERAANTLQNLVPLLDRTSVAAAASPGDKRKQEQLAEVVAQAKSANNELVSATTAPEDQILASTAAVNELLQRLARAVRDGDTAEAEAAVKALKDAINQQLMLARQLAEKETDPWKKEQLLQAIADLEEVARQIEPVARKAMAGDRAAQAKLEQLLRDAADANNRIAELSTSPIKQQIAENAKALRRALDDLERAVDDGDRERGKAALSDAEKGLIKQIALVKNQAAKEHDPRRKESLLRAQHALEEVLGRMPAAVKASLANPRDQAAKGKAKEHIANARDAADRSAAAVRPSDDDLLLKAYNDMREGATKLPTVLAAGAPKQQSDQVARDVVAAAQEQAFLAPEVVRGNGGDAGAVQKAVVNLEKAIRGYNAAAVGDPSHAKLKDASDDLNKAATDLLGLALPQLKDKILDASQEAEDALDRLQAAVRRGNRQDAVDALHDAEEALLKQAALARALAALPGTDPNQKKTLLQLADALEKLPYELKDRTNNALAHPDDSRAQQEFNDTVQKAKELNAAVVAESHPDGEEQLLRSGKDTTQLMQDMLNAARNGDREAALRALDELEKGMRRQAALARALGIRSNDPAKKKALIEAALALQNGLSNLLGPIRDALLRPGGEEEAAEMLARLLNDTFKINAKTEAALVSKPQEEEEEEPTDEIMQAARSVEKVVQSKGFIDESTPEGRLYAASRKIAEEMALMSDAAARSANSEIIVSARRIAALVQNIFDACKEIADKCKDPILRDQVMSVAHAIRNITTQLKIITAVKAAGGYDAGIKAQLVKCAKTLARNTVSACNAVEIACLRL